MKIQINDNWKLETDAYNYILLQRVKTDPNHIKTKNEYRWEVYGYYQELETVANDLIENEIRSVEAVSMLEWGKHITKLKKTLYKALKQQNN